MLEAGWLPLKQAQEALKNGRLEDAAALLRQPDARGHKKSWELLAQLTAGFVARAEESLGHHDTDAAWADLTQAELAGKSPATHALRQTLTRTGIEQVRGRLDAGEPAAAGRLLDGLRERAVKGPELAGLDDLVKCWAQAAARADRGEFAEAVHAVGQVCQVRADVPAGLLRFRESLAERHRAFTAVLPLWREALIAQQWREVLTLCDRVLAVAPDHEEARAARSRAWRAIEPPTVARPSVLPVTAPPGTPPQAGRADQADNTQVQPQDRYILWVDGVGGFLICLKNRVVVGRATPDNAADVPLLADVSRHHATLVREAEGYLLEAPRPVEVNDRPCGRGALRPGDRLKLGGSCRFVFRLPAAVSATARLDPASGYRLTLGAGMTGVDGVLLMADTLILGPGTHAHVEVPDLPRPVVIHRHRDGLGVRLAGAFTIDGRGCQERGVVPAVGGVIRAEGCTFAIEPVCRAGSASPAGRGDRAAPVRAAGSV